MRKSLMLMAVFVSLGAGSLHAVSDEADMLVGRVVVRGAGSRIVVAVGAPDDRAALAARVFVFQLSAPLDSALEIDTAQASLLVRRERLTLSTPRGVALDLAVHGAVDPSAGTQRSVATLDGIGLADYKNPTATLDQLATAQLDAPLFEASRLAEGGMDAMAEPGGCPAGGPGSTSCSISSCCSVSCSSGYYACCHCTDGCHCIANGGGGGME